MPKIFISYRRKSWPFTHRMADDLRSRLDADIFVDFSGIDEADFEKSILSNLRASDVVLLVVSEHTFADRIHKREDWVRREIREALANKIPLVMVSVEGRLPPPDLPDDIRDVARMQAINFYPEYFPHAVDRLAEFVVKIGAAKMRTARQRAETKTPPQSQDKAISGRTTFHEALDLLDAEDYKKAIFLLRQLQNDGFQTFADLDKIIAEAEDKQATAERRYQAQLDYKDILALWQRRFTRPQAEVSFHAWCEQYTDLVYELDTAGLLNTIPKALISPADPIQAAVERARRANITRNADWTPETHTFTVHGIDFEMCLVPPGSFMMGSEDGRDNEKPVHQQTITDPYWIGLHPVTNAQWRAAVAASGGAVNVPDWADWYNDKSKANHPVVGVTWHQCRAFVRWLGDVWNLPTEVQWEYAARGPDALVYPWGNDFQPDLLVYNGNSNNSTAPVGGRPGGASWVGAHDMSGNVWEWTLTKWRDYTTPPDDDPGGNSRRVLRGGAFDLNSVDARAAARFRFSPDYGDSGWGFRLFCASPIL